jgi:hypothetical protein
VYFSWLGYKAYVGGTERDARLAADQPGLFAFLGGAWKIDAILLRAHRLPEQAHRLRHLRRDRPVRDRRHGLTAPRPLAVGAGSKLRALADGSLKSYALWIGAGAVLMAALWMFF